MSVVLITAVSRSLGLRLAAQLAADPTVERVIGIDTAPPRRADLPLLGRTEFVRADIRNPLIAQVVSQAGVTTVVHAGLLDGVGSVGGRTSTQEMNVIGTMQLLAACQKSDTVGRVVLRSTTAVYGAGSGDPAVFVEDGPAGDGGLSGYSKDAAEVEGYVRGFARRRPDVDVTVLRFAPVLGTGADTALGRYLRGPIVPTPAGFDPRLQLLHESDAVEALRLATVSARPGVVNVAGAGVLSLAQIVRRLGRLRVPVPGLALAAAGAVARNAAAAELDAQQAGYLRFGRVVDTTRLLTEFGYRPAYTTEQTVDAFGNGVPAIPRLGLSVLGVGSDLLHARRSDRATTARRRPQITV
ncbi:NAD-dependent epimerase/dehydratase family protein [uncultured Jatrophihabitans sp.]|uniref:NAD-dependent epimerase/dehydratase family protein n=1 Tax=uncultured Jatrophihabitans sp. TaxID=1610747 RepID=UPI0035CA4A0D